MHLSLYEQETVINFNRGEKIAYVATTDPIMIEKLKEMQKKAPDKIKVLEDKPTFYKITCPKKWCKVRLPRLMTEEEKAQARDRLMKAREKKDKD